MEIHPLAQAEHARAILERVIDVAREESPFAASVAQLAIQATTTAELESLLAALYRVAVEQRCAYVAELVDSVLVDLERSGVAA